VESITFDRLVDDVFAVLDAYAVEHCVLAAESAGALTALGAALKNPQRVTGFGLLYRGLYRLLEAVVWRGVQLNTPTKPGGRQAPS